MTEDEQLQQLIGAWQGELDESARQLLEASRLNISPATAGPSFTWKVISGESDGESG